MGLQHKINKLKYGDLSENPKLCLHQESGIYITCYDILLTFLCYIAQKSSSVEKSTLTKTNEGMYL